MIFFGFHPTEENAAGFVVVTDVLLHSGSHDGALFDGVVEIVISRMKQTKANFGDVSSNLTLV